jgi:hypothetical protein
MPPSLVRPTPAIVFSVEFWKPAAASPALTDFAGTGHLAHSRFSVSARRLVNTDLTPSPDALQRLAPMPGLG